MSDEPPSGDIHIGDNAHIEGDAFTGGKHIHIEPPARRALLHTLNDPPPDFTGREQELDILRQSFAKNKGTALITGLTGAGGIGKTALARCFAREMAARYPVAQLEIDLQGPTAPLDPYAAMRRLLECFYPGRRLPDDPAALRDQYRGTLKENACLLLLDNARSAEQVKPLLPPAPSAAIVTSRWDFSLPAQGLRPLRLDVLEAEEAAAFLRRASPRLELSGRDPILFALAKGCGHYPLALRIAAALFEAHREWQIMDLLARLQDERQRLAALKDPDDPDLDLEASLELSYRLLSQDLQATYRCLGVFSAPFEGEAARAVFPERFDCGEVLNALGKHGLLEYQAESRHYALHDVLRLFAQTRLLAEKGEAGAALERAAVYYLAEGAAANTLYKQGGENIVEALQRFRTLWPHLEALWPRLADVDGGWPAWQGAARWLCDLPGRMAYVLDLSLPPRQRIPLMERALSAARALSDKSAQGAHLNNLGLAYAALGETRRAIEYHEQALAIYRETGDRSGEGNALNNLGLAYADLGETRRAIELYEQALVIDRQTGDRRGESADLGNLGVAYADLGETRRAIEFYEQQLVITREIGDRRGEGAALNNLGLAYAALGETRRAIELYEQSLKIKRETGDRRGEGNALTGLGLAYAALGETRRAIEFYEQALVIARQIGDRRGEGNALGNLGIAYADLGETRRAIEFYEQALVIYRQTGDRRGEGSDLGNAYAALGETRRAIEFYEQQLAIARQIGDRRGEGRALANMGWAYQELGEIERVRPLWQQALTIYRAIEDPLASKYQRLLEELDAPA